MVALIFLSLFLVFGSRFIGDVVKNKEVKNDNAIVFEKASEPSSSPVENNETKVEGAKVEVKVETKISPAPAIQSSENINNFKYPNAKILSSSSSSLTLESSDGATKITDWYKEKIEEKDMNIKTFVTTKANEKIENKLVGADGESKIQIEIKGDEGGILTIKIDLTSN